MDQKEVTAKINVTLKSVLHELKDAKEIAYAAAYPNGAYGLNGAFHLNNSYKL